MSTDLKKVRPQIDQQILTEYAGKVLAISKASGEVIESADTAEELRQLMADKHGEVQYRPFCCPR